MFNHVLYFILANNVDTQIWIDVNICFVSFSFQRKSRYRQSSRSFKAATCDTRYRKVSDTHTMCLNDVGRGVKLAETSRTAILNQHNHYRSRVSPTASNMQKMVIFVFTWQSRQLREKREDFHERFVLSFMSYIVCYCLVLIIWVAMLFLGACLCVC